MANKADKQERERWLQAGRKLKAKRRELRFTLKDLAGRIGCCFSYISDIETGQKRPSYGTAQVLADALQLDLDEICCGFGIVPPDVAELVTRDKGTLASVRELLRANG